MAERLSKPVLYTFGVGDLFFTLMVNMEVYYFAAFLTDFAQFSLTIVDKILTITAVSDIICALLAGFILQKVTLKFGGKYRSWLLVGPPIVAPLFILQFSKLGSASMAAVIITLGFIASHLVFNVVFAATGSMVGTLSQRPDERTILSSSRAQGMSAAGLIFSVTGPIIVFFGTRTNEVTGHTITTAVYAALMILGYWYIYKITAGRKQTGETAASVSEAESRQALKSEAESKQTVVEIVALVLKNPPLLLLIIAETFRNTSLFVVTGFAFYYFGYVLNNPNFLSLGFILAINIAALLGTMAAAWIGVKLGKRKAYWLFLILAALSFASALLIGKTTWGFTIIFSIGYMFNMTAGAMSTALFADSAIYGEWKTGKSIQGFTMSLLTLPIKAGILIRAKIITIGLIAIGFVANAVPPQNVVEGIRSIMIFSPVVASAIAAATFYFGYRIDDKDIVRMQEEIASR
jgi:Na+/melibiose symporter-like transporter